MVEQPIHTHNGIDSPKIDGRNIVNSYRDAITQITDTADGTYSANEVTMLNNLKTAVNNIIITLQKVGITK